MDQRKRQQLTLFIRPEDASAIESIREKYNPEQQRLIAAHVTLCREDEIENLDPVLHNLQQLAAAPISIQFGSVTRFDDGKGLLIPAKGMNDAFDQLRLQILAGTNTKVRQHEPHITLMHPRNSTCTDEIFEQVSEVKLPESFTFNSIALVEQINGGRWGIVHMFTLKK